MLPAYVNKIIDIFEQNAIEAYAVGGCVRDVLMNIPLGDIDIAVGANTVDIKQMFDKVYSTGEKYGTVTVIADGAKAEVTMFRAEGNYTDHRHPSYVDAADSIEQDLSRRDFTINAIAYNKRTGLIDPFGGQDDLKHKVIRTVGNPDTRFSEDYLRIMRAFRFASTLDFEIEPATQRAAVKVCTSLRNISRERIYSELKKLLSGKRPSAIEPIIKHAGLEFLGLTYHSALAPLDRLPQTSSPGGRLAALCYLCAADVNFVCQQLKCENITKKTAAAVYSYIGKTFESEAQIKRALSQHGQSILEDICAVNKVFIPSDNAESVLKGILTSGQPYCLKMLAVNGDDIKDIATNPTTIGKCLSFLLKQVIENPTLNQRETLLNLAREFINDKL